MYNLLETDACRNWGNISGEIIVTSSLERAYSISLIASFVKLNCHPKLQIFSVSKIPARIYVLTLFSLSLDQKCPLDYFINPRRFPIVFKSWSSPLAVKLLSLYNESFLKQIKYVALYNIATNVLKLLILLIMLKLLSGFLTAFRKSASDNIILWYQLCYLAQISSPDIRWHG